MFPAFDRGWAARAARLAGVSALALVAANCSKSGIDSKYGVPASPRVVAEGDPVPKGTGRRHVGKPYTVAGRTYVPRENPNYVNEGLASWYGSNFHGRLTANGEIFDRNSIAAAHTTMPLPSYARVTNVQNGHSIIVRVNDRGPFHGNRIIDVSQRTAEMLDFKRAGTVRVRVEYLGPASTAGSDDRILMASLRTDGRPAVLPGSTVPTAVAQAAPAAPAAPQAVAPAPVSAPALPPGTLALQSTEAEEVETPVASPAPAQPAFPAPAAGPALSFAPLPPERPFDLGTIPFAAVPVAMATSGVLPPARPAVAALYFAPLDTSQADYERARSFQPQSFKALGQADLTSFKPRS